MGAREKTYRAVVGEGGGAPHVRLSGKMVNELVPSFTFNWVGMSYELSRVIKHFAEML